MRHLLVAAVVALLLGCQQSPAQGPQTVPLGSLTAQLRAQGDQLAARGDYAGAVVKYEAAVSQERGDSSLWFALGVALSHLDRREETVTAFRRVMVLGQPDSQEVRVARSWLVRAGVLAEAVPFAPSAGSRETSEPSAEAYRGPTGSLRGTTEWAGLGPKSRISIKMVLSGEGSSAGGRNFSRRVKLGKPYAFKELPPGVYRLVVRSGRTQLWDQSVTVEAGRETVINLRGADSLVSPDEFPKRAPKHEDIEEQRRQWRITS